MRTKNPEQGLELKIILNPSKRCVAVLSSICRFHFEMDNVLGTDFVRCDMNDVTILHALCIEKTLCTTSSVSERGDMDSENHSVVIWSIGSHSVKATVSRLITLMGIY